MKALLTLTFSFFVIAASLAGPYKGNPQLIESIVKAQVLSDGNNISTTVWNTGVLDQDLRTNNTPGLQWPKGQNKFAMFTAGLSMSAYINDSLRLATISYNGEYAPGYISNGVPVTNSAFKLYRVNRGDNNSNPDYANWGLMVPYGAPFDDVNMNGIYEPGLDKPGMKNAAQTIFVCLTDGFPETHAITEGFSGGTLPVKAEMHLTCWSYDNVVGLEDVQFVRMEMVNKNSSPWKKTHFGFVADPDIGDAIDDYIGCDVPRNLGYCYNADNMDGNGTGSTYGANPPAIGIDMLKGGVNRSVTPNVDMYMTSFCQFLTAVPAPACENDPSSNPTYAYNYLRGLKRDSTPFVNPQTMLRTKYCFSGDPETNVGWTEYVGKLNNCGGDTTGTIIASIPGDKRFVMGSGANNFTVAPGEKQTLVFAQMVARGTSNKNSVTKLKLLSDAAQLYYNANFSVGITTLNSQIPEKFSLYQNYPNPFNPTTKIKFDVRDAGLTSLKIYDIKGREVAVLVNQNFTAGTYEYEFNASNLSSGIYFYTIESPHYSQTRKMSLIK